MHAVIVNVTIDRPNSDGGRTEEAYSKVRERSLITAGCPARSRRIFGLSCRFDGQDREIEVGSPLRKGGDLDLAIFDHGRSDIHIHPGADAALRGAARQKRQYQARPSRRHRPREVADGANWQAAVQQLVHFGNPGRCNLADRPRRRVRAAGKRCASARSISRRSTAAEGMAINTFAICSPIDSL